MGLGKTLQVIARLLTEREEAADRPPTLIIAPTSVLSNWRKEIERFAPQLRTLVHQGSARNKDERSFAAACQAHDVVLTSFALARLDEILLRSRAWHRVVVRRGPEHQEPAGRPRPPFAFRRRRAVGMIPPRRPYWPHGRGPRPRSGHAGRYRHRRPRS